MEDRYRIDMLLGCCLLTVGRAADLVWWQFEKDGIPYSARLDGDKSAVTVRKSEAPAYFSRKKMKKLAQEVKAESPKQGESKSKGQEL